MVKKRKLEDVQGPAVERAEQRIVDALLPGNGKRPFVPNLEKIFSMRAEGGMGEEPEEGKDWSEAKQRANEATRQKLLLMLRERKLEERELEIDISESAARGFSIMGGGAMDVVGINIGEALEGFLPKRTRTRSVKISEARRILQAEEAEKLVDMENVVGEALEKVQEEGIVFLDELDKIVAKSGGHGPDVSREGVQRDLLPIVEGSTIQTKYGQVKTDHILFIAAGAFSSVKPSDLVPELQGRFPIRVELDPLGQKDLVRILSEPENSLLKQYKALIGTEGIDLVFTGTAVEEIASLAEKMNGEMENIGARRLHTMMEQLLEEISFSSANDHRGTVEIDDAFVIEKLEPLIQNRDMRRYLL
jgi:ATP-dependent HslUV protease ATP-binding subunit HslU